MRGTGSRESVRRRPSALPAAGSPHGHNEQSGCDEDGDGGEPRPRGGHVASTEVDPIRVTELIAKHRVWPSRVDANNHVLRPKPDHGQRQQQPNRNSNRPLCPLHRARLTHVRPEINLRSIPERCVAVQQGSPTAGHVPTSVHSPNRLAVEIAEVGPPTRTHTRLELRRGSPMEGTAQPSRSDP